MSVARHTLTLADLRLWATSPQQSDSPVALAVLGDPVSHSLSPQMHQAALRECGISVSYARLHIRPEELSEAVSLVEPAGFRGVNLTIPHKAAILPLIDSVTPEAQRLGVVNTVDIRQKRLTGYNTDGQGLVRAVKADFGADLRELRVLVTGAGGGAGRAVSLQCAIEGCSRITLVNRTLPKAEALAKEVRLANSRAGSEVHALEQTPAALQEALRETDIILQCSSLGMNEGDPSPIPPDCLRASHLVYDTIYSRPTRLLLDAAAAGAKTSNGLSMLLHQGALAFEIWFQREAPVEVMKSALLTAFAESHR